MRIEVNAGQVPVLGPSTQFKVDDATPVRGAKVMVGGTKAFWAAALGKTPVDQLTPPAHDISIPDARKSEPGGEE